MYPDFVPSLLYRDAALLVLTAPTTASTVPLWTAANAGALQAGRAGEIVGWGQEYYEQEGLPLTLKWANTAIQSPEWCAQNAPDFFEQGELCTIDPPSYSTGACHGDSGGPLLASSAEGPVEVGITSHIYGECSTVEPTIFTRTDILVSWVHEWAEAEKPPTPASPPAPPPPSIPLPKATATPTAPAPAPKFAIPPSMEGLYRGSTSQSTPINVVVGAGGHRITAIATKIVYRCRAGHSITEPMDGLSNGESEPINASHAFTVAFSGEENETITGAIDAANGEMSGSISAHWRTHRYGLCSTGRISWSAQRAPATLSTTALAGAGNYRGWTNQGGHVLITVAHEGRQLIDVQFSARYQCPGHRSLHLTESFLSPTEPSPLEGLGTFTVELGGHNYSGRVDGAFGFNALDAAFGTLEASTITRYGRCRTGIVPWET
ncbi:MAG: peptidase and chymotrypsin/Hap [Solirubrobacterales bacterium]|nr:peptidase and chymotrypsin/Hap [Solirubrobacterales bacterium]